MNFATLALLVAAATGAPIAPPRPPREPDPEPRPLPPEPPRVGIDFGLGPDHASMVVVDRDGRVVETPRRRVRYRRANQPGGAEREASAAEKRERRKARRLREGR